MAFVFLVFNFKTNSLNLFYGCNQIFWPLFCCLMKFFKTTLVFWWTHVFLGFEYWIDISTGSYWRWFVWGALGIWNVIVGGIGILLLSIEGFVMVGTWGIRLFNIKRFIVFQCEALEASHYWTFDHVST